MIIRMFYHFFVEDNQTLDLQASTYSLHFLWSLYFSLKNLSDIYIKLIIGGRFNPDAIPLLFLSLTRIANFHPFSIACAKML